MRVRTPFLFSLLLSAVFAVPASAKTDDVSSVLARLDAAAKKFHTVSANVVFDTETLDPVPDSDIQKATAYYERKDNSFSMAAHIHEHNGKPSKAAYTFVKGALQFYDGSAMHTYDASKWESYLMLGFGASGTELADKWNIKYIGSELMNNVNVAQLELVAKDPNVRKTIAKVTLWIDPDSGVSQQQRFDEGPSLYRICKYSDIQINQSLPAKAKAAPANAKTDDLNSVLARLDTAAKNFHTVSANVVFDTETVDPVPDTDIQKATAYYERKGNTFRMAAHIHEHNGKPSPGAYKFEDGKLQFYDGSTKHIYNASKWESYLMLGFGASGTELASKWDIKYIGSQVMNNVNVAQLELVAKDPNVRKTIAKVTLWIDPDSGVSQQQRFDEGPSLYRICKYSDIQINQSLPAKAFDLPK